MIWKVKLPRMLFRGWLFGVHETIEVGIRDQDEKTIRVTVRHRGYPIFDAVARPGEVATVNLKGG